MIVSTGNLTGLVESLTDAEHLDGGTIEHDRRVLPGVMGPNYPAMALARIEATSFAPR